MALRQIIIVAGCCLLTGCSFGTASSSFDFSTIPRVTIPAIHLMGVPLYGEKPEVTLATTRKYQLSSSESDAVRRTVAKRFSEASGISFYPLRSGVTAEGTVAICGMVSARSAAGKRKSRLFRGTLDWQLGPGRPSFSIIKISGANASTIEVFSDCQRQNLA